MFLKNNFANYYKTVIFIIMAILFLIFLSRIMDVAIMIFVAFIVSASILPFINKLQKHMPRALAVILMLLLVLGVILLIFIPLINITINQGASLVSKVSDYVNNLPNLLNKKIFGYRIEYLINDNTIEQLAQGVTTLAGNILSQGINIGKIIAASLTSTLMISLMVFYFCIDEKRMKNAYVSFFPPKFKKKAKEILDTIQDKIGGFLTAQLLTMAGVGLVTFFGLLIAGHPHSATVSFLAFILDFIPVIGSTIAVIIGTISAYEGGIGYMALILGIMLIAQIIENQFLRPYLFGKFMNIHPLLIIVSLLIGAKFLGFAGIILGPAFAAIVCILIDELYIKQINSGDK